MTGLKFIPQRKSYWGEPPLGCECGAILPIRADRVRPGSRATCTRCGVSVTFDATDVEAIGAEITRLKTVVKKPLDS